MATTTTTATTLPPTTTSTSTTSTTVPPWTTVPEPERPPVLLGGLVDEPVETMCVEVTNAGLPPHDNQSPGLPRATVARYLPAFGIEVVESGACDATLEAVLTVRRTSATYETVGTCWSGWKATMEASLLIDGRRQASWTSTGEYPPPFAISWCPERDDSIDWSYLYLNLGPELVCEPYVDLFGNLAAFAICRRTHWVSESPLTEEELSWLAYWEYQMPSSSSSSEERFIRVASFINAVPEEWHDVLLPLVPYLVRGDWSPDSWDRVALNRFDSLIEALASLTGVTFESQEQAWEWWESNQP